MKRFAWGAVVAVWCGLWMGGLPVRVEGQNVVDEWGEEMVLPVIGLGEGEIWGAVETGPELGVASTALGEELGERLAGSVEEVLGNLEWKPFHHTLGISGYEELFGHPDELVWVLSLAKSYLKEEQQKRVEVYVSRFIENGALFEDKGFEPREGAARESYRVPENLRPMEASTSGDLFRIYSLWTYCHYGRGDLELVRPQWPKISRLMKEHLDRGFAFDSGAKEAAGDAATKLNADIAGMVGFVRLAGQLGKDERLLERVRDQLARAMEARVNLDRMNSELIASSRGSSKRLHYFNVCRYEKLVPEVARLLREQTDGLAARRLKQFRNDHPTWHLAFGDRLVGGENYTNPAGLARSLFAGAALVEEVPAEQLRDWLDVPWCRSDLSYIEKLVWALWAEAGRPEERIGIARQGNR